MLFPSAQLCMMFNLDADCVNIMPQAYFQCYLYEVPSIKNANLSIKYE